MRFSQNVRSLTRSSVRKHALFNCDTNIGAFIHCALVKFCANRALLSDIQYNFYPISILKVYNTIRHYIHEVICASDQKLLRNDNYEMTGLYTGLVIQLLQPPL